MSNILEKDLQRIIKDFDMSVFDNKTVFITGATGLLGSLCVKSLLISGFNIQVIALVRNKNKAENIFSKYISDKLTFITQDINDKIHYDGQVDYIIHCANSTSSKEFIDKPVETLLTTINGTKNVLEFAKSKPVLGIVYLSSLEVYGVSEKEYLTENDYGYIDILSPRSSYSEGKKAAETLCISYGSEYGIPVKIARLAQTFGAGVSKGDNRVFAQFVRSVVNGENIVLHTKGETKRNYCYTTDAITGIFTVLTKGENNSAYNIANKESYISILEMAKMLENDKTKVVFEIDNKNRGYNPTVKICLDSSKLEALGWKAKISIKEMFEKTIQGYLKGNI